MASYSKNLERFAAEWPPERLTELDQECLDRFTDLLMHAAPDIWRDFDEASTLRPYWNVFAPLQRGRAPTGESVPWGEVGEKVLEGHVYSRAAAFFGEVRFLGFPYGHDIRFLSQSAYVQLDVKSTGPNDNADEIVVSPNQLSGPPPGLGALEYSTGHISVNGPKKKSEFRPELPPFVEVGGELFPIVTACLKCVYMVVNRDHQFLDYLELAAVPNGLLLFGAPGLAATGGLLIPGTDEKTKERKRVRVRLDPLATLGRWRCRKIASRADGGFSVIQDRP